MIILKYWREILIALIIAAVLACGWYLKSTIDRNREMAAQVKLQQTQIANLANQVKQVDAQRKLDNALTLAQLNQRTQQQTKRKHDDAAFKLAVQSHPETRHWIDEYLPADTLDRLRESTANRDGQTNATAGPTR